MCGMPHWSRTTSTGAERPAVMWVVSRGTASTGEGGAGGLVPQARASEARARPKRRFMGDLRLDQDRGSASQVQRVGRAVAVGEAAQGGLAGGEPVAEG